MAKVLFVLFLLVVVIVLVVGYFSNSQQISREYETTDEIFPNPVMGYAPWFHTLEKLPEDANLVYLQILWKDLEPKEGVYDWKFFEEQHHLSELREMGYHLVIRFICDYPGQEPHRDIPQWLYNKTTDGVDYDIEYGCGYSPNYANPVFIQAHAKAVAALGSHFGGDSFVSFVELGSLGHWGEWHVKSSAGLPSIPNAAIRDQYVKPWVDAFPNAQLLMRRPFAHAEQYGLGIFNDMVGKETDTLGWLDWIQNGGIYDQTGEEDAIVPMPEAWKTAAIGGEFTSSLSMEEMLSTNLAQTVAMIRESHTTFLGPKEASEDYPEGREQVLGAMGYRIGVAAAEIHRSFHKNVILLTWENTGVAPLYWDWPVRLYVEDGKGNVLKTVDVEMNLSELLPGTTIESRTVISGESLIKQLQNSACRIALGIVDPMTGRDAVRLTTGIPGENGRTILFS